jgi:hypothetical protein
MENHRLQEHKSLKMSGVRPLSLMKDEELTEPEIVCLQPE